MTGFYIALTGAAIVAFVMFLALRNAKREGASEVKETVAKAEAKNADAIAKVIVNDKPDDVDKRLSDGDF